ncbi:uncharacterized protein [Antedon mediterranea]|uniref:uncharacterized protein n=1 Tax=Antedon mediterranea TaxID=105859 RepID=UPI003AF840FE
MKLSSDGVHLRPRGTSTLAKNSIDHISNESAMSPPQSSFLLSSQYQPNRQRECVNHQQGTLKIDLEKKRVVQVPGTCTRAAQSMKTYPHKLNSNSANSSLIFCLLNARSLRDKSDEFTDFVVSNDIDIVAVSETWLRLDDNLSIGNITPLGYCLKNVPRLDKIGGGKSFFCGDFNIHIDTNENIAANKCNRLLQSFNLIEHVNEPTHDGGHCLDLIITRDVSLISGITVKPKSCNNDLGIENGKIPNSQMTASSFFNTGSQSNHPYKGRLQGSGYWAPATKDSTEYIQVDLGSLSQVSQVATQGSGGLSERVTEYNVKYSTDGNNFIEITAVGGGRFPGNTDGDGVVTNSFSSPVYAQYIRIYPYDWSNWPALRMELYGCAVIDANMDAGANVENSASHYGVLDEVKTDLLVNTTGLISGTSLNVTIKADNMQFNLSADPFFVWKLTGKEGEINQTMTDDFQVSFGSPEELFLSFSNDEYFTSDIEFIGSINSTVNAYLKPGVLLRVTIKAEINDSLKGVIRAEGATKAVYSKLPRFVMNVTEQSADGSVYVNVGQKVHINLIVEFPKGTADPTLEVTLPYNFSTNTTSKQWSINKVSVSFVSNTLLCTYSTEFCYYAIKTQYIANEDDYGILKDWSVTQFDGFIEVTDQDRSSNVLALEVEAVLDDTDAVVNGSEYSLGLGVQIGDGYHVWVGEVPVHTLINKVPEPKMTFKISYEPNSFYKDDDVIILVTIWHEDDSKGKAVDTTFTLLTSKNVQYISLESEYTELFQPPVVNTSMPGPTPIRFDLGTIQIAAKPTFRVRLRIYKNRTNAPGTHRFVGVADLLWFSTFDNINVLSFTNLFQFKYSDRPDIGGELCRSGYTPYMKTCYQVFNSTLKTWDAAKTACEEDFAQLVMIDDAFEQQFLRDLVPVLSPYKYWIGIKDVGGNNVFKWTDGSSASYTKWLPNRPGNSLTEDCGAAAFIDVYDTRNVSTDLGDWDIMNCTSILPAICEYPIQEEEPAVPNPAKEPLMRYSKWANTQTCVCHYDSGSNQCDCCVAGAYKCEDGNHTVCVSNPSNCPVTDYYDRGFVITKKLDDPVSEVIFACNPSFGRLYYKLVPSCYVQDDPPDGSWKALPMYMHNIIGSDQLTGHIYGIHMDMRSYMHSKDHGATWEFISKGAWDSITKSLPDFKTAGTSEDNWLYDDNDLKYNNVLKFKNDCC